MSVTLQSLFSFVAEPTKSAQPVLHIENVNSQAVSKRPYKAAGFNSLLRGRDSCIQMRRELRDNAIEKRRNETVLRIFKENQEDFRNVLGAAKHMITNILAPAFESAVTEPLAIGIVQVIESTGLAAWNKLEANKGLAEVYAQIRAKFVKDIGPLKEQCQKLVEFFRQLDGVIKK